MPRQGYRIGVPQGGDWDVLSDAQAFAGSGAGSQGRVSSESCGAPGQQSLVLDLPPLGTLLLRPAG